MARMVSDGAESPQGVLEDSATGEVMRRAGSDEDVAFCARVDVTEVVPVLVRGQAEERWPVLLV